MITRFLLGYLIGRALDQLARRVEKNEIRRAGNADEQA